MLHMEHLHRQTQQILPRAPGGLADLLTSMAWGQPWPTATGFLPHTSFRQERSVSKMGSSGGNSQIRWWHFILSCASPWFANPRILALQAQVHLDIINLCTIWLLQPSSSSWAPGERAAWGGWSAPGGSHHIQALRHYRIEGEKQPKTKQQSWPCWQGWEASDKWHRAPLNR